MMKKKDGVALGAAALFALTGCVADMTYATREPCAQPLNDAALKQVVNAHYAPQQELGGGYQPAQAADEGVATSDVGPVVHEGPGGGEPPYPPNAKPGECYSRCIAPAQYKDVTERIMIKPATERIEHVPAKFEWAEERVVAKEASERIETIPPKFEWREERIVVKPESKEIRVIPGRYEWRDERVEVRPPTEKLRVIPAKYDVRQEQVVVKPASKRTITTPPVFKDTKEQVLVQAPSTKWIRTPTPCSPEDSKLGLTDCETLCLVETPAMYKTIFKKELVTPAGEKVVTIPAEYETVTKEVVVSPAKTEKEVIPAEYTNVRKKIIVEPPRTEEVTIPAEYDTIRKNVMVEPAQTRTVPVPPEYKTIRVKKIVQDASERRIPVPPEFTTITKRVKVSDSKIVWRAVLCEDQVKDSKIMTVQRYLNQEGFDPGPIDGNFNAQTQQALRDFQRSKGLPEGGGLTIETLEALGIYQ